METVTIEGMAAAYGRPEGPGPFSGIIVLHEAFGLNDDIRRITERFASEGYAAVAPNLYSPGLAPICTARTVLDMARGGGNTIGRIDAVRRWLADRPEVDGRRIGVIGFCMGGGFALTAAVRHDFAVASVNYGRVPREAADLEGVCPVVASYGKEDRPLLSHASRLTDMLEQLGAPHDVKVYPGAGHSFMNRGAPGWVMRFMKLGYKEDAAEDSWRRILNFFSERLRTSPASGSE